MTSTAQDVELENVLVTGSRIARRDFEAASPIVTVDSGTLRESAAISVEQALAALPQFVPAGTSTSNNPSNDGQANVSLRGLGVAQTLVLLDGRRLVPADGRGSADLNVLPAELIQSVEIVTGGASATYGSDAIAGVVNIKLRSKFEGVSLDGQWSQTEQGDGTEYSAGLTAGSDFAAGRGSIMAHAGFAQREQIGQTERNFSRFPLTYYPDEAGGLGPGGSFLVGGAGVTEEGVAVVFTNPAAFNQLFAGYGYAPGSVPLQAGFGVNPDRTVFAIGDGVTAGSVANFRGERDAVLPYDDRAHTYDFAPSTALQLPLERSSLFVRGTFEWSPHAESYLQAIYTDYTATRQLAPTEAGISLVPPSNPYVPEDLRTLLAARAVPAAPFRYWKRTTEVGPRTATNDRELFQVTVGARGPITSRWEYDAYVQYGRNARTELQEGLVRLSKFEELTFAPDGGLALCGGFDPFGKGSISPECAQFIATAASNEAVTEQAIVEATVNGPVLSLPAGALRSAFGVFHKRDEFTYTVDPSLRDFLPIVPGVIGERPDVVGLGVSADRDGQETNTDIYAELLVPLLRDARGAKRLDLDFGYRHSEYSRAGGADSYKAELLYEPVEPIRVRGSFQHAVRAPSVDELYFPPLSGQPTINPPDPCSASSSERHGPDAARVETLCIAQGLSPSQLSTFEYLPRRVDGVTGGNPDLTPEQADTYSFGVVLRPATDAALWRNLQVTLDWYWIEFTDAIGRWPVDSAVDRCFDAHYNPQYAANNVYCSFFRRSEVTGEIFALTLDRNIGGRETSGVDLQLDWASTCPSVASV